MVVVVVNGHSIIIGKLVLELKNRITKGAKIITLLWGSLPKKRQIVKAEGFPPACWNRALELL